MAEETERRVVQLGATLRGTSRDGVSPERKAEDTNDEDRDRDHGEE